MSNGGNSDGGASSSAGATAPGGSNNGGAPAAAGQGGASSSSGGQSTFNGTFRHPGVLVTGEQLSFVKAKLQSGAEPWKSALAKAMTYMRASDFGGYPAFASLTYVAHPVPAICCGSVSKPDIGCKAEQFDASAAYTTALIWAVTGNEAYGNQSIAIMNAYANVLKRHYAPTETCTDSSGTSGVSSNTIVQSGWVGSIFPRAAEIMRTDPNWSATDSAKFKGMLQSAYLVNLQTEPADNGNWELSVADALVQIGVFLDDQASFNQGLSFWRKRVPAYIYLSTDGASPIVLSGAKWNASSFFDGLCQETCRDLHHPQLGFAAMINAAETARIQGVDLYGEQATRIIAGLETEAQYLNQILAAQKLAPDPGCSTAFPASDMQGPAPMWEIAYNHYVNRLGRSLPSVQALITKIRPTGVDHHMDFETLSHAELGSVGIQ
jgi:hypothetical protein